MATQIDLGAVVPIGKGDWNPSTTYERANIVRHNSTAWICKVDTSIGVEPTEDSLDWYLLVKDTSSVTSVNGMKGDVTVNSILKNPDVDDNSLKIASTSWVKTETSSSVKSVNGIIPDSTGNVKVSNKNVGDEWFSYTGKIPAGGVPYCGQTVTRSAYADLWNYVQEQNLVKTESEWQELNASQNGNVPFYSDGDGNTTFRMPKVVGYVKGASGADGAGAYTAEGLPNITGNLNTNQNSLDAYGAFSWSGTQGVNYTHNSPGFIGNINIKFAASRSNPIYGNSTHVTPETITVLFGVYAFGELMVTGSTTTDALATGLATLETRMENELPPIGSIIAFAANSNPEGYLICNGAAISRTTYTNLYAKIGDTYGAGDGSSTFNLPNLMDRFIQGSDTAGTVKEAGLPNITGSLDARGSIAWQDGRGAFYMSGESASESTGAPGTSAYGTTAAFNASRSNAIYGKSNTVQPPAVTMRYYIKY